MDKRIEKTKKALHTAFMQLRAEYELRDIKISLLCQTAEINKTTFYSHYRDIYELADDVEKQLLHRIISSIPRDIDYTFHNPAEFTREITLAFDRHMDELRILFRGSEYIHLSMYMEQIMKQIIFDKYPALRNNAKINLILTYCIQGAYSARVYNPHIPENIILETLQEITNTLQPLMNFAD